MRFKIDYIGINYSDFPRSRIAELAGKAAHCRPDEIDIIIRPCYGSKWLSLQALHSGEPRETCEAIADTLHKE